jgi:ABC-type multidrug transport system ATPase subunit
MEEAEYCDRMGIVYQGRIEAEDSPEGLKDRFRSPTLPDPTLEDVFVGLVARSAEGRA